MRTALVTMALLLALGLSTMINPASGFFFPRRPSQPRQYYHVEHHENSGKSLGFMKKIAPSSPVADTPYYYDNYPPYYGHPTRPMEPTYYGSGSCPGIRSSTGCSGTPVTVKKYPTVTTIASGQLEPQPRPAPTPSPRPQRPPQPKPTYNNQVSGRGNVYEGANNVIRGDGNTLRGDENRLNGHQNVVVGDENECCGVKNCLCGDRNDVKGCRNFVKGESNNVVGGQNKVRGSDNNVSGCSNKVKGENNCVNGSGNKVYQNAGDIKNVPKITRSSYKGHSGANNFNSCSSCGGAGCTDCDPRIRGSYSTGGRKGGRSRGRRC